MTKVTITAELDLDIDTMAKAFAHMGSNDQARFLKVAYQEMGTYTDPNVPPGAQGSRLGDYGRELQFDAIAKEMARPENEDAEWFARELLGFFEDRQKAEKDRQLMINHGGLVPPNPFLSLAKTLPCDECGGTGFWVNPAGGRHTRSPCSKGCKP